MAGSYEQWKSRPPGCHYADAQPGSGRVFQACRGQAVFRSRSASLQHALIPALTRALQLETKFLRLWRKSLHLVEALAKLQVQKTGGKPRDIRIRPGKG